MSKIELTDRERDVQSLCKQVLEAGPDHIPSSGFHAKENHCPFCTGSAYWDQGMEDIEHEQNCAYLIAKDLSTGMK